MEYNKEKRPKVGTGVFIMNNQSHVLFLLRKGSHGAGTWCLPGGYLEYGESFLENAQRETKEETDVDVSSVEIVGVTNDLFSEEQKHYVTVFMKSLAWIGTPKIMEPSKCTKMEWFGLGHLPDPLFVSDANFFSDNPWCLCGSNKRFHDCHQA